MTNAQDEEKVQRMAAVLRRHQQALLDRPGCTGVAIGRKRVGGPDQETDTLAITVFVERKRTDVPEGERVPTELDGFPTDVLEQEVLLPELCATDPFAVHDPVFGGLSLSTWEAPQGWGSIGCFINTTGDPANNVPPGDYLLTNQHVLAYATPPEWSTVVIQPTVKDDPPPEKYWCGNYVAGYLTPTRDCAITTVTDRRLANKVPNYPWYPGYRNIRGVGLAVPGDDVYKYGATTKFTKGRVVFVNYTPPQDPPYQEVILISSEKGAGDVWNARGDSGSVTIRQSDDFAVGLNFAGTSDSKMPDGQPPGLPRYPAYFRGMAYDLTSQMQAFVAAGGRVGLSASNLD
ncbi:hypothetical protein ACF08B_06660 [Streptomyces sp. NPDC015139]|uniref:hypothetical protein n=1 Tax=Streptomyces sp. NPDC015139 TaxID=3364942 RepID=UPI0036F9B144